MTTTIDMQDGRDWFQLSADTMERYMALAAEQLGEPKPSTDKEIPPWD